MQVAEDLDARGMGRSREDLAQKARGSNSDRGEGLLTDKDLIQMRIDGAVAKMVMSASDLSSMRRRGLDGRCIVNQCVPFFFSLSLSLSLSLWFWL